MPVQLFRVATGTAGDDFILDGAAVGDVINGGDGDDFILGDSSPTLAIGTATSFVTAASIDDQTMWTRDENPFSLGATQPHTSLYVVADPGQAHYVSVTLGAGAIITIDIDFGDANPIGVNADLVVQIFDSNGVLLITQDDFDPFGWDGAGSQSDNDSLLGFQSPSSVTATYIIRFSEADTGDGGLFEGGETFVANFTVMSHAVGPPTAMDADTLSGGNGDDSIAGQGGHDTLRGDAGNDMLSGGSGDDLIDGGSGSDTAWYGDAPGGVVIDLNDPGAQSTIGAGTDTLVSIEHLVGSRHGDILIGNAGANNISGSGGDDTLVGGAGNDRLTAGNGHSSLIGGSGDDILVSDGTYGEQRLIGGDGNDSFTDAFTNDLIDGGGGIDSLDYSAAWSAVFVDLALTTVNNTGGAGNDTLSGIENLTGTNYDDLLSGAADANVLDGGIGADIIYGRGGTDTLIGGAGNDTLDGGDGVDLAYYAAAAAAVTVNLGIAAAQNTLGAGIDTLSAMENVTGSTFADSLTGDGAANALNGYLGNDVLRGAAGNDTLIGGEGNDTLDGGLGNDSLNGGNGIDIASYATASAAVRVNLAVLTAQDTLGAGLDTLTAIENVTGSTLADILTGNSGANALNGYLGNDVLLGGAGNDNLIGGEGGDLLDGGLGNDIVNGGNGTDNATYASAAAAVAVNLGIVAGQNTLGAGIDTLSGIENLTGSNFNDTLMGDASANGIAGGAGNDLLNGRGGNDSLIGGAGADSFRFDTPLNAASNVDLMSDFTAADDTVLLSTAIFTAIGAGTLSATAFQAGTAANDAADRIIYDSATGRIYYDADGSGAGAQILFARVVVGTVLSNLDFVALAPAAEAPKTADEPLPAGLDLWRAGPGAGDAFALTPNGSAQPYQPLDYFFA